MNLIIEELQKYGDKELREILSETNIYKARYVKSNKYDENSSIFKNLGSRYCIQFLKNNENKIKNVSHNDFINNWGPLLYDDFKTQTNYFKAYISNLSTEDILKIVKRMLVDLYGENKVDINTEDNTIVIHYPKITIKNSAEQEHIMRDIYLKLYITNQGVRVNRLYRGTLSPAEINSSYLFSHVCGLSAYDHRYSSASFCFGYNNPIKTFFDQMYNIKNNKAFKNLKMLPYMIEEYLSWESIDGVPYRYIDNVINGLNTNARCPRYDQEDLFEYMINNIKDFKYEYIPKSDDSFGIKLTPDTVIEIRTLLTDNYPDLCFEIKGGESVDDNNVDYNNIISEHKDRDVLQFKGETVKLKIYTGDLNNVEEKKYIHTDILKNITSMLEQKFEIYLINKEIEICRQEQINSLNITWGL